MKYRENSLDVPVNGRKSPISHRFYDDLPVNGRLFRESLTLVVIPDLSEEAEELFTETLMQHFVTDPRQHHALVDARALRVAIEKVEATLGFGMN
ncbi:MAG: hypothetical protein JNK96_13235 [Betaproteobacteria bacterium]|nr:hypothetical protein [Betaproteobacteria bacterium]